MVRCTPVPVHRDKNPTELHRGIRTVASHSIKTIERSWSSNLLGVHNVLSIFLLQFSVDEGYNKHIHKGDQYGRCVRHRPPDIAWEVHINMLDYYVVLRVLQYVYRRPQVAEGPKVLPFLA
jgi:hypothetical protein